MDSEKDLLDREFDHFLAEYQAQLDAVKAPEWTSKRTHPETGRHITFGHKYEVTGNDWRECFEAAISYYQNNLDKDQGFVDVTNLDSGAIVDIARLGQDFQFIPREQLQVLMETERNGAAYEQFASGKLPENTSSSILQGALAEAIQREAYKDAARLHELLQRKD